MIMFVQYFILYDESKKCASADFVANIENRRKIFGILVIQNINQFFKMSVNFPEFSNFFYKIQRKSREGGQSLANT